MHSTDMDFDTAFGTLKIYFNVVLSAM